MKKIIAAVYVSAFLFGIVLFVTTPSYLNKDAVAMMLGFLMGVGTCSLYTLFTIATLRQQHQQDTSDEQKDYYFPIDFGTNDRHNVTIVNDKFLSGKPNVRRTVPSTLPLPPHATERTRAGGAET